jgi:hypothetical protein
MVKRNFVKGERTLDSLMMSYRQKMLLEEVKGIEEERKSTLDKVNTVNQWLSDVNKDISRIHSKDPSSLKKMGIDPSNIKEITSRDKEISPDEWRMLKKISKEANKQKEMLAEQFDPKKAERYVKKQQKQNVQRSGTKSMFVRRSWLSI